MNVHTPLSIPAADILALADSLDDWAEEWLMTEAVEESRRDLAASLLTKASEGVRALVAAAEQADKGEATDTPRDDEDEWAEDRAGHAWDTSAPAAPVGVTEVHADDEISFRVKMPEVDWSQPPADDDHGSRGWEATETGWRCTECHASVLGQIDAATDAAHRCRTTARVPVNDEAEAQTAAEVWHKWVLDEEPALPPEWWDITRRAVAAGFRAARQGGNSDEH